MSGTGVKMSLYSNINYRGFNYAAYQAQQQAYQASTNTPSSLTASMINRIHKVRPGCSSWGK